jgi:hypothetical protein
MTITQLKNLDLMTTQLIILIILKFNFPLNSFMECSNIPMLCMSNINMINTVSIKKNYYFLESNSEAMKEHIKSSAIYDMIETN